jgi:hypothetical protein
MCNMERTLLDGEDSPVSPPSRAPPDPCLHLIYSHKGPPAFHVEKKMHLTPTPGVLRRPRPRVSPPPPPSGDASEDRPPLPSPPSPTESEEISLSPPSSSSPASCAPAPPTCSVYGGSAVGFAISSRRHANPSSSGCHRLLLSCASALPTCSVSGGFRHQIHNHQLPPASLGMSL